MLTGLVVGWCSLRQGRKGYGVEDGAGERSFDQAAEWLADELLLCKSERWHLTRTTKLK